MTDFLLVPGAGQGAETWGNVWGHLTAPVGHPPPLRTARAVGQVRSVDFLAAGDTASTNSRTIGLGEAADHIAGAARSFELQDLVVVGHAAGAALLLAALPYMTVPPKRVVMFAGIVPREGGTILGALPPMISVPSRLVSMAHQVARRDLRLPQPFIFGRLCNGMDPMEVFRYVSTFRPLPVRVLQGKLSLKKLGEVPPVTYVVLERDRVLSPRLQRKMAGRLPNVELLSLDACHQAMLERPKEVAELILQYA